MAGSILVIVTVFANAFWAGLLLGLRPGYFLGSDRQPRGLTTGLAFLLVPSMLIAGVLIALWGVETVLLLGGCLAALAFLGFERRDSWVAALGSTALLAGGAAILLVGSTALMQRAFFPLEAARSVNLGFVAVLVGGLLARPLTKALTAKLGARIGLLTLALFSLVPAACVVCTSLEELPEAHSSSDPTQLLSDPRLGLWMAMAALCFPLEASLAPWLRRHLRDFGHLPGSFTLMGMGFWLAFLGSRVVAALNMPAGWEHIWLLVFAVLATVILGNMLAAHAPGNAVAGMWLTGACLGPLLPTLLGLVLWNHPESAGPAVGLTCTAGMLGNFLVLPWIDASHAEHTSRTGLRGATLLAGILMVPALVVAILG